MEIKEITVKSALHFHENPIPTNWDLNVYRGCQHGCKYCFAQYSHDYLNEASFYSTLLAKINIAEVLDKELRKHCKKGKFVINIGGVTDSYQPCESKYKLMPKVLELLNKYKFPVILTTKSLLIKRDIDLIAQLAKDNYVQINTSISTVDEKKARILEPYAANPIQRIEMLKIFKEKGCRTGILYMPIIPYITDSDNEMETLFSIAKLNNVDGVIAWALNLRGKTKPNFLEFAKSYNVEIAEKIKQLYAKSEASHEYLNNLKVKLQELKKKHDFRNMEIPLKVIEKLNKTNQQLSLF